MKGTAERSVKDLDGFGKLQVAHQYMVGIWSKEVSQRRKWKGK